MPSPRDLVDSCAKNRALKTKEASLQEISTVGIAKCCPRKKRELERKPAVIETRRAVLIDVDRRTCLEFGGEVKKRLSRTCGTLEWWLAWLDAKDRGCRIELDEVWRKGAQRLYAVSHQWLYSQRWKTYLEGVSAYLGTGVFQLPTATPRRRS